MASLVRIRRKDFVVSVLARTGAAADRVGVFLSAASSSVEVRVAERAVNGAANAAILKAFSGACNVPVSSLSIVRGSASRSKLVAVESGEIEASQLSEKLVSLPRATQL